MWCPVSNSKVGLKTKINRKVLKSKCLEIKPKSSSSQLESAYLISKKSPILHYLAIKTSVPDLEKRPDPYFLIFFNFPKS